MHNSLLGKLSSIVLKVFLDLTLKYVTCFQIAIYAQWKVRCIFVYRDMYFKGYFVHNISWHAINAVYLFPLNRIVSHSNEIYMCDITLTQICPI
jgi:hypothetical protein